MKPQFLARSSGLVLALLIALAAYGCSKKAGLRNFIPNQRPTVVLTSGPIFASDTVSFSIVLRWSGDDPDGRIDHFEYAIDPKDNDTLWVRTTENKLEERFSSRDPLPPGKLGTDRLSVQTHTFVIKAIDNVGQASVLNTRSFTSSTISPTVVITSPLGSNLITIALPPTTHIEWVGDDPDGVTSRKPNYYLWKLFKFGNSEFDYNLLKSNPDSLRRFYAKTNFAGWDTVPGPRGVNSFVNLPTERSPNLELGKSYMFVVVAFDTAKAYSPVFCFAAGGNMLEFQVGFAGNLGPPITAFNDFFLYRMPSGGLAINEQNWVRLEVPAAQPVTFNWSANEGSRIQWFRWRVNGDWQDEEARTNEATDWYHWSVPSAGTTTCTFGPFIGDTVLKRLMIEAMDANGLYSILTIAITPVVPTFDRDMLIVDDCRPEVDQYTSGGLVKPYTQIWPSATELDTFLYARGGVPWRGTQVPPAAAQQPVSPPGLFAGYSFDTLGTRLGLQIASSGVPLSVLGKYRHLIWMVDKNGGEYRGTPLDQKPQSTLHWMCTPNHLNTLGSYMTAGGSVWLLGGDAAFASLTEFNARGAANNDGKYPGTPCVVFSSLSPANELVPGRLMYGGAHWRSEMVIQTLSLSATTIRKSTFVPKQPWTSPGWNYSRPLTSPDYSRLPAVMRTKSLARGDSLPPTRTVSSQFYGLTTFEVEYLTQPNEILEDNNPNPFDVLEASALDSLMEVKNFSLVTGFTPAQTMTYYHGVESPEFIFSGFNFWMWTRDDCKQLIVFVLEEIWKMPPPGPAARSYPLSAVRQGTQLPATARPAATPVGAWSRIPRPRTAGR